MADSVYKRFGQTSLIGSNQTQTQHAMCANDSLPKIAAFYYNTGYDSELWRQIAEANGIDDLDALTVGTVLVIPSPKPSAT